MSRHSLYRMSEMLRRLHKKEIIRINKVYKDNYDHMSKYKKYINQVNTMK